MSGHSSATQRRLSLPTGGVSFGINIMSTASRSPGWCWESNLLLFRYGVAFPIAVTLLIQTLQIILFSYVYWTTTQGPAPVKVAYSALMAAILFSATQMENFIWPFQVGFAAVFCAASIAILSLMIKHCRTKHHKAGYLSLSILSGICATGSLSNRSVYLADDAPDRAQRASAGFHHALCLIRRWRT